MAATFGAVGTTGTRVFFLPSRQENIVSWPYNRGATTGALYKGVLLECLSRMKETFPVRFLGGLGVVRSSGYPIGMNLLTTAVLVSAVALSSVQDSPRPAQSIRDDFLSRGDGLPSSGFVMRME